MLYVPHSHVLHCTYTEQLMMYVPHSHVLCCMCLTATSSEEPGRRTGPTDTSQTTSHPVGADHRHKTNDFAQEGGHSSQEVGRCWRQSFGETTRCNRQTRQERQHHGAYVHNFSHRHPSTNNFRNLASLRTFPRNVDAHF